MYKQLYLKIAIVLENVLLFQLVSLAVISLNTNYNLQFYKFSETSSEIYKILVLQCG